MAEERLPTEFWVAARLRRFSAEGRGAYLLRRGDADRGTVIVRLIGHDGVRLLTQIRDQGGRLGWMPANGGARLTPMDADSYVERAVKRDSDLWVIEVETRGDENPFEGELIL